MDAATKSPLQRFVLRRRSNKPSWPAPQDSIGDIYKGENFGRKQCWDAKGPAREQFHLLALEIKEYLETHSDPVPRPVTWTVYMIGATAQLSRPTVMFCSDDKISRTTVRNKVRESGLLEKYPGFDTGACSREFQRFATDIQRNDSPSNSGDLFVFYNRLDIGPGMHVYMRKNENDACPYRKARCGGIIHNEGNYFLQTVAHLFDEISDTRPISNSKKLESFEFELDDDSDDDMEDENIEISSRGSATPEPKSNTRSSSSDSTNSISSKNFSLDTTSRITSTYSFDLNAEIDEETREELNSVSKTSSHPILSRLDGKIILSTGGSQPSLDYCLIEIPSDELIYFKDFFGGANCPTSIGSSSSDVEVSLIQGGAALKGKISGTPSFIMLPGYSSVQEVWIFRHASNLLQGDCGSWVIDATTATLYGHLVAGNSQLCIAYIMPAQLVIGNIRSRFEGTWSLANVGMKDASNRENLPRSSLQSSESGRDRSPPHFSARLHQHHTAARHSDRKSASGSQIEHGHIATHIKPDEMTSPPCDDLIPRSSQSFASPNLQYIPLNQPKNVMRRLRCDIQGCGKPFSRHQDLLRHRMECHGPPKKCPWCDYKTRRDSRLFSHMDRHRHPERVGLSSILTAPKSPEELRSEGGIDSPSGQLPLQAFGSSRVMSQFDENPWSMEDSLFDQSAGNTATLGQESTFDMMPSSSTLGKSVKIFRQASSRRDTLDRMRSGGRPGLNSTRDPTSDKLSFGATPIIPDSTTGDLKTSLSNSMPTLGSREIQYPPSPATGIAYARPIELSFQQPVEKLTYQQDNVFSLSGKLSQFQEELRPNLVQRPSELSSSQSSPTLQFSPYSPPPPNTTFPGV